ncbi:hypothetical protein CEL78_000479 [Salmonella enterica subsp. enterica serovar Miami]|nr:hypothetical protein [Salmonella enterica subsp. enterica serovar Miami]
MHVRHYVVPALWLPLMVIGAAQAGSQIRFQGTVVEAGCWNETGVLEVRCHRQDGIERHIIVENMTTSIASPYAMVESHYLDEDKQLALLRIIYD